MTRSILDLVWSRLQEHVSLAVTVVSERIPVVSPELHLKCIPGQHDSGIFYGGSSIVFKFLLIGRSAEPEVVVVKCPKNIYNESDASRIRKIFERESKTWKRLSHKNILPLIGITYDFGPIPCIITPWMEEGTLTDFIHRNHGQLNMERRFVILHDIASGLQYLHHLGVVHGDLTGSNILVGQHGRVYISDFGLSFLFLDADASVPSNICAHPWAAIELFNLEESKPVPTTGCDIYSFGCVFWQVLSGRIPFSHISRPTHVIILKFEGKDPVDERPSNLPVHYWEFLQSTWSKKPESRPSSDQILTFVEGELERFRFEKESLALS